MLRRPALRVLRPTQRPGRNPLAGTYKGRDEVAAFFSQLVERSGGTFSLEIDDWLASDAHVVVLVRESGQRDGKRLDVMGAHIWRLADGKAVDFRFGSGDQHAQDEFWS